MTLIPLKKKAISASPCSVVRKTTINAGARTRQIWRSRLLDSRPFNLRSHLSSWPEPHFFVSFLNLVTEEPVCFGSWSCHVPRQTHINTQRPAPTRRAAPLLTHAPRTLVLIRVASPYLEIRPLKSFRKKRITVIFASGRARCIS